MKESKSVASIVDMFLRHVAARPDQRAALVKRDGVYKPISWKSMWDDAMAVAKALVAAGIEPDDRVCIVSHTRLEWVTCDLGILAAAAVTVPIYPSNLADECQYVSDHSGARLIFTEDAVQSAKLVEQRAALSQVTKVVQIEGELPEAADAGDGWVVTMADFLSAGSDVSEEKVEARYQRLDRDSILTIIYTSGTTGRPKGVVLTHANMIYEGQAVQDIDFVRQQDVQLLFLPLAHVFAKVLEIAWFASGHVMAFAENMTTIRENLGEVRPTLMCGVPRVFEKFHAAVVEKGTAEEGLKKKLFLAALALSQKNGEAEERGEELGLLDTIKFTALKRLIFAKIGEGVMNTLGGRMRVMLSGGAPLSKKINWFFRDAGITIVEGYGMTESSAGTSINLPHANQIGTVGPPLPGSDVKIADDGEILIKGPGVMREYWRNPEATAETLVGDWLHTGDIGEVDRRTKAVRITDRKKDLIVTAGGKNVAPQKIEGLLKVHKLVSQAVVHGDRRNFLSALITLDEPNLTTWAEKEGIRHATYAELTQHDKVRAMVQEIVNEVNGELASYETIKKFAVLERDFSIEQGELTPKLSLKRKVVNSKFGHILDEFYAEKY